MTTLEEEIAEAERLGHIHMIVKVVRKRPPSTMPGSVGVAQAKPRLVGRYLGEGNAPGVYVYDVLIHDLKRALR